ncbi:bifunctional 2-C-methyl-D-erythritol 4-phosphate cytidylyltransferase/2-C-methyl-D-erythritol 2,4-cyclodiphosphate synthase [Helicobacter canis]|nr:bifunctional 2-C-methyl-D-erythritol 4-phosphate cytidylyltransferase/2-C-methyl-D-erythritol 2,4-cyclodiphosphate synthase [Helicobacter canis]
MYRNKTTQSLPPIAQGTDASYVDSTHLAQGESISLILMAAGSSSRFTQTTPTTHAIKKQWLRIGEKPLWLLVADTLSAVYPFVQICITASEQDAPYMQKLCPYTIVVGGETRQESLQNALRCITSEWVLVSDVARAGVVAVGRNIIAALVAAALDSKADSSLDSRADCVAPILAVPDTSIYDGAYIDRSKLARIQTPQLSRVSALRTALESTQGTDESSIIKANGGVVRYIQGDRALEKLTLASDLLALEQVLAQEVPSFMRAVYVGNGLDVHSFEIGKEMKLGGVVIESEFGFKAHSDGDVALHSVIDAILGAMGAGDIGEWFPDSSSAWAGADSAKLLEIVWGFAKSVGYELYNIDLTIIAQTPRLSAYKQPIRARIAEILGAPLSAINVKATTTEHLGFIGRAEGVCVMSSVCLRLVSFTEVAQCVNK